MLRRIAIRDFVIVEETHLEFEHGFTVLTGETGAGKSILIDALSVVLGERGEAAMVRAGAGQAEITAEFDFASAPLAEWLLCRGLEGDPGICLIRRILDAGGRSRAFINGHPSTLAQVRELGEMLLDIHGQHAHQSLLRASSQRELLDAYGACAELAGRVGAAYRHWSDLSSRHASAQRDADRLAREREALGWQIEELERLDFRPDAWDELNAEHARLTHASSLIETASAAIDAIADDEHSSLRLLNGALSRLSRACDLDPSLKSVADALGGAQIELQEAVHALERYRSKLEVDPQRLTVVEGQIDAVHGACRKFQLHPDAIPLTLASARARRDELELDLDLSRLEREVDAARLAYHELAGGLTQVRKKAGARLARQVSASMQDLALVGGKFSVVLAPLAEPSPHGMERVEFRVAAHAGVEPGPLGKVASGGELSRLSLAVQTALSQVVEVPTLIFDEVDAGIGGRVAEIVGQMLHRLSARHQIMCVTHLAQVASCADRHYRVAKLERAGVASSTVELLGEDQRVEEIARMLGGVRITATTMRHAEEMLRNARRPMPES